MAKRPPVRSSHDLQALYDQGVRQLQDRQAQAARQSFRQVLARDPTNALALGNLGMASQALREFDAAEAYFRRALAIRPRNASILRNLGILLVDREKHAEALALADKVLAADPDHAEALLTRGNALNGLQRFEEAVESYARAARIDTAAYEALTKLGWSQAALGLYDEAHTAFAAAIALRPADPLAYFRRGLVRLKRGDFAGGWADYEHRWDYDVFLASSGGIITPPLVPRLSRNLTADDLAGRRVLVLGEQGIGDQLMFASMIPDLARTAAEVACICEPRLVRLFSASFPGVTFSAGGDVRPAAIDHILAMASLGSPYRQAAADFPGTRYLAPSAAARAVWAQRLGPRRGLRIGLSWRGGVTTTRTSLRSLTLDQLVPILGLPDCEFVSLQYGDTGADLAPFPSIRAAPAAEIDDMDDLAGLVANLDLVVSVQTAVVHLAGALGVPCLTLVPHSAEWRYGDAGPDMPWYRSIRLFRQADPGDWPPVIKAVAAAVRERLAAP